MDKKKLLALIAKKNERKAALAKQAETCEDVETLRKINTDLETLNEEIRSLQEMADGIVDTLPAAAPAADSLADPDQRTAAVTGQIPGAVVAGAKAQEQRGGTAATAELKEKYEKRGADLKAKIPTTFDVNELPELRSVAIASGTLVVPTHFSDTLNPAFNQISGLIDAVNAVPLNGGEAYEKGFEIAHGEGGYTTETGEYHETDPVIDYVSINKAKITAYTEITDEATKLPNVDYQALVARNIGLSLRRKITRQIIIGTTGANSITGIFNAPEKVIPAVSDIEISEIDEDTLDKIVFSYGGEEDVEGGAYLILNKADLAAFAKVRGADGHKLYTITLNGNTGTISSDQSYSVTFVINGVCPSIADATMGTYCMAYGMVRAYEMPIFSPVTVEESRDYKFRTGQVAYRGSVWAGGNVAMYKGFVRVKKA